MKISFLAGFAAGYVLGAKAGPERYEQIKSMAAQVKDNPTVQQTTAQVTEAVKGKASDVAGRTQDAGPSESAPSTSFSNPATSAAPAGSFTSPGITPPTTAGLSGPGSSFPGGSLSGPGTLGGTSDPSPLLAARTVDPLEAPILPEGDIDLSSPASATSADPFDTRP